MPHTVSYLRKPGNLSIGYVVLGRQFFPARTPLVFVNGMGSTFDDWESLTTVLAQSRCPLRSVLLYDHRGMGVSSFTSATTNTEITLPIMAQDLLDLIRHLEWSEVDLIGWSMGGVITQQFLHANTSKEVVKVSHAIFGATAGGLPECEPGAFVTMGEMFAFAQAYTGDRTSAEFSEAMAKGAALYFDPEYARENPKLIQKWIAKLGSGTRRAEIVGVQGSCGVGFDLRPHAPNLPPSVPLLVIQGTKDRIVLAHEAKPFLALPHSTQPRLGSGPGEVPHRNFGHAWWEYFTPEVWGDIITEFLDGDRKPFTAPRPNKL